MDADRERRDAEQPTPARGGDGVLRSAGNRQKLSFLLPPLLSGDRERISTREPWYQERLAILPFLLTLRELVAMLDVKQNVREQQKRTQSFLFPHLHIAENVGRSATADPATSAAIVSDADLYKPLLHSNTL